MNFALNKLSFYNENYYILFFITYRLLIELFSIIEIELYLHKGYLLCILINIFKIYFFQKFFSNSIVILEFGTILTNKLL